MKMGGAQERGDGCLQIFKHPTQKESRSVSGILFLLRKKRTTDRWTTVGFSSFSPWSHVYTSVVCMYT